MKFRTEYHPIPGDFKLNPEKPVVLVGSCFSQNIAAKMEAHRWKAILPCGTLYNPSSICISLELMTDSDHGSARFEKSLFLYNGLWNSNLFDSSFSSLHREDCLEEFKKRQTVLIEALETGGSLIVTFGTAICYYPAGGCQPVGNCHKQPSSLFFTRRITTQEMVMEWSALNKRLQELFPHLKVIFTVSPVRHIKDGFAENARSKAILLLGVEEICRQNDNCSYFPAFEIMNDDLRDYRFYAGDLLHPSEAGIDYVWGKFLDTFVDAKGLQYLNEGSKTYKAEHHRQKTGALGKPLTH